MTPRGVTDVNASIILDNNSLKWFHIAPDDTKKYRERIGKTSKKEIGANNIAIAIRRETGLEFFPTIPSITSTRLCPLDAPAGGSPRGRASTFSTGGTRLALPALEPA